MTGCPNSPPVVAGRTADRYRDHCRRQVAVRRNSRGNPGVLSQTLALEVSVVQAFRAIEIDPARASLLDVGCGGAGDLHHLIRLGFSPQWVAGIDIMRDRMAGWAPVAARGRRRLDRVTERS
jgi:SAM-dependent methyltransferase